MTSITRIVEEDTKNAKDISENVIDIIRSRLLLKRLFILCLGWWVMEEVAVSSWYQIYRISFSGWQLQCATTASHFHWVTWLVITMEITKWWCQFYLIRFVFVSLLLHSFDFPRFVEVPGLLFGMYFMDKAGRRMTVSGSMMLSGIACLSAGLSPAGELINTFPLCLRKPPRCYQTTSHNITQPTLSTIWRIWFTVMEFGIDPGAYRTVLFLLGKLFISCCFAGIYSFTSELFPTAARSAAMGLCSTSGRIGGIAAPIIADLVSV